MRTRNIKARTPTSKGRPSHRHRSRPKIPTALIEPNVLFREGLKYILSQTRFSVMNEADIVEEIKSRSLEHKRLNMVVLCTTSGDKSVQLDIKSLKERCADCRVICSGPSYSSEEVIELLRAGADGILLRNISADTFIKSLELVMLGERVIPAATMNLGHHAEPIAPVRRNPPSSEPKPQPRSPPCNGNGGSHLSERELAILRCLLNGEANKIIALNLDIAEATVKVHVKAILRKIRVQNRTQAAIWALNHLAEVGLDEVVEPSHAWSENDVAPTHLWLSKQAGTALQLS
jgi:two-component system nitrate/nitrite response regulator NarL